MPPIISNQSGRHSLKLVGDKVPLVRSVTVHDDDYDDHLGSGELGLPAAACAFPFGSFVAQIGSATDNSIDVDHGVAALCRPGGLVER